MSPAGTSLQTSGEILALAGDDRGTHPDYPPRPSLQGLELKSWSQLDDSGWEPIEAP